MGRNCDYAGRYTRPLTIRYARRYNASHMSKSPNHPLAAYRKAKDIKPSIAAAELDISRQSLFRIEKGEQKPSVDLIKRIEAFTEGQVSANDLVRAA